MDFTEYRQRGKEMVDYIADYLENIRDRRVYPDVKPGYMKNLLPDSAPIEGENWDAIFSDVNRVIMPGITHWQSPHMHAYFPALNSFPSLLGDMLADAINCLGFTWASSPACTELEIIVMNWLGKMINLPDDFLHLNSASRGGGVVQTTASEATLVCLLAGRTRAIQRFHEKRPGYQDAEINARLVAYCSDQAHSSVEKAALIGLVRMRYIEADENLSMRGQLLREAIEDDIRQGLVPFWVCATLGTTGSCSFDNLEEVGSVCREFNLWLHVDAAYAGSAFICPEYRTWLKGIEKADSIAFNPSKWLMIHFDATALWVKDSTAVHRTFNVEPLYLQHENSGVAIDYMHWQIPLSRRFRALKIWFVLRSFGIKGLQRHIREGVRLAQKFEALVLADHRFEIPAKRHLGLVVFRIKGENEITERLLKRLNHRGNLHCIPSSLKGKYVIRFTVTSTRTTVDDILKDWMEIKNSATAILDEMNITISNRVYLKDTKEKCEGFGSSLLLSNSPLSPKIVNGSFAALFDADEFLAKTYAGIRITHQDSPSMRRRVRGILMSGKQFSLDSHMDVVVQTSMVSNTTNSKMCDSYGKTAGNMKNKECERDAICEDEESPEECAMNWNLNTALQLNNHQYLAVFNRQNRTPIDVIHHQNNLAMFTKYLNKCHDVNNYTNTRSVNSVRTPLTQYQLYKLPSSSSINVLEKQQHTTTSNTFKQNDDYANLYPGKRFLNLDLPLYNVTSFTDTIFNLPTPTEDIIPIIITEGTPTTCAKTINDIEDLNKLRPPITTAISTLLNITEKPNSKKPEIPKKPAMLSSILNEIHTKRSNTIKTIKATGLKTPLTPHKYAYNTSSHDGSQILKPSNEIFDSHLKETTDETLNTSTNKEEPAANPNLPPINTIKSATASSPSAIPSETLENFLKSTIPTTNTYAVINEITNSNENRILNEHGTPSNTSTNLSGISRETVTKTSKDLDSNPSKTTTEVVTLNSQNSTATTATNNCETIMGINIPAEKTSSPTSTLDSFRSNIPTTVLDKNSDLDSNFREPYTEILNTNPTTLIANLDNDLSLITTTATSTNTLEQKTVEMSLISNETLNSTTAIATLTANKNVNESKEVKNNVLQEELNENSNSSEDSQTSSLASDSNESLESLCQPSSSDSEGLFAMDLK